MIYQGKARYPVREVVLHTSATPGHWQKGKTVEDMVNEIRAWHTGKGWRDIGYHRVIAPNGDIGIGRSLYDIGAHVRERNRGTVGICLIPVNTHKGIKDFSDYFTGEQEVALKAYLKDLGKLTDLKWVTGHNDYANKECPGFKVRTQDWL